MMLVSVLPPMAEAQICRFHFHMRNSIRHVIGEFRVMMRDLEPYLAIRAEAHRPQLELLAGVGDD
jgi:hypothetical protein